MGKVIALSLLIFSLLMVACSQNKSEKETSVSARAPVSITHVRRGAISDSVALSATTYYLSDHKIAAPVSGYIIRAGFQPGDEVKKGQVLFEVQTREASALQPDVDSSASFSKLGVVQIKAPTNGFITVVTHIKDDYVQEGGALASVVNPDDLHLKLFVPYEYRSVLNKSRSLKVVLPSGEQIEASISGTLNQTDSASQSVVWLLKPDRSQLLPEGLKLTVYISTARHDNAQLLPKEAVLADETLQSFWVMKAVNDSLAVRVPITKSIETERQVEIKSPQFAPSDSIIVTGQYGLEDSSLVHIIKPGS